MQDWAREPGALHSKFSAKTWFTIHTGEAAGSTLAVARWPMVLQKLQTIRDSVTVEFHSQKRFPLNDTYGIITIGQMV